MGGGDILDHGVSGLRGSIFVTQDILKEAPLIDDLEIFFATFACAEGFLFLFIPLIFRKKWHAAPMIYLIISTTNMKKGIKTA